MATYLFGLLALFFPYAFDSISRESMLPFIGLVFSFTFLLPVMMLNLLRIFNSLPSYTMNDRKERVLPFILITICYTGITAMIYHKNNVSLNDNLLRLLIAIDALVVVATFITFFYKISVHSIAMWGLVGILFIFNTLSETSVLLTPIIGSILLAGVVMSSRLALHVHTLGEVLTGAVTGLATSVVVLLVLLNL